MTFNPFLKKVREAVLASPDLNRRLPHKERAHSKFSASGAERWFQCPGSVELSESLPEKTSSYAIEGTEAHEVLEKVLNAALETGSYTMPPSGVENEMFQNAVNAVRFILQIASHAPGADVLVESRVLLDFIHPNAFGTLDVAIIDYFETLHVFDYKYGRGVPVSPKKNLQMIFYALALAHRFQWNFKRARLWIIQPRIKGYDGPVFWDLSIPELKSYIPLFKAAVLDVEASPNRYVEGAWCHWCRAKTVCPLKRANKIVQAQTIFGPIQTGETHEGKKKEENKALEPEAFQGVSEADWRKKARTSARKKKTSLLI